MSLATRLDPVGRRRTLTAVVIAPVWGQDKPAQPADCLPLPAAAAEGKAIDLVLCLDVSGSMNGLIESAKLRLWDIVNELARMKPTPNLRVALYSYGATSYPADKGWVRKELDLTEDLDDVYKMLTALHTGGGEEYVARVSKTALDEQKWSTDKDALRLIFVAGNEPVDQDKKVPLDDVAAQAKKAGVIVNTIYCGCRQQRRGGWVVDVRGHLRRTLHEHRHEPRHDAGRREDRVRRADHQTRRRVEQDLSRDRQGRQGGGREPGRPGQERRQRAKGAPGAGTANCGFPR